jgi:hypothetical protein
MTPTEFRVYRKIVVVEVVTVNANTTQEATSKAITSNGWIRVSEEKPTEISVIPEECFEDDDLEVL